MAPPGYTYMGKFETSEYYARTFECGGDQQVWISSSNSYEQNKGYYLTFLHDRKLLAANWESLCYPAPPPPVFKITNISCKNISSGVQVSVSTTGAGTVALTRDDSAILERILVSATDTGFTKIMSSNVGRHTFCAFEEANPANGKCQAIDVIVTQKGTPWGTILAAAGIGVIGYFWLKGKR